jgi:hypothetical protein
MDPKKDLKEDPLADVNLASLNQRRMEAVEKQKAAADAVQMGKAGHFLRCWLVGGAMFFAAVWLAQTLPEYTPIGMFVLSFFIISWLGLWIAAFFSTGAVRRLQDKATAASRHLIEIDLKIAFGHQVQEEVKKAKVKKFAQALLEKDAAPKKQAAG